MTKNKSNNKRPLGFLASPVVLIRTSSVLFVLLMFGHTSAYPWNSTRVPQETQLGDSMKSVEFVFLGEHSTYWNLYFGWGVWMAVSLLTLAIILWLLSDLSHVAPRNVGVISGVISATSLIGAYLSFRPFLRAILTGKSQVQILRPDHHQTRLVELNTMSTNSGWVVWVGGFAGPGWRCGKPWQLEPGIHFVPL